MVSMALVVFFLGINVGGHRAFRPSVLAKELGIYDAVNVGAAGHDSADACEMLSRTLTAKCSLQIDSRP